MKLLILDTEKTYNIGVVVIDTKQVLEEKEFVIPENFNDPLICGEANHKRKTKQFNEAKHTINYVNAAECINQIATIIKRYQIQYILGHNVSEDRIQFGNLLKQAEPYLTMNTINIFKDIKYFDTQKIVRTLLPNNKTINLQDTAEDLTGLSFSQSHTALADAQLLSKILLVCGEFLPLFLMEIELNDEKTLGALSFSPATFMSSKYVFEGFQNKVDFTIKAFNTQCDKFVQAGLLTFQELPQYSEKTGKQLQSTLKGYKLTAKGVEIHNLLKGFKKIDWITKLTEAFKQHVVENDIRADEIKAVFEDIYRKKQLELEQQYKQKQSELEKERQSLTQQKIQNQRIIAEKINSLEKDYAEKTSTIKEELVVCAQAEIRERVKNEQQELDKLTQQVKELKKTKNVSLAWHIICPILGVALGVISFVLLYVLK